jgi:hypothetical protein
MTESEYKENNNEVIDAYYDIYTYNLEMELITLEECELFLDLLEEGEAYLECAGIFKAINNYKAIKEERFNDLWLGLNGNTE